MLFTVGLFFLAPNTTVIDQTFVSIGGFFFEVAIKTVLAVILFLVMWFLFFKIGLRSSRSLKDYFVSNNNDSHVWLFIGIAATVVIAVLSVKGINIQQYLYNLCIKMPVGYFISTIITLVVARLSGLKTIENFRIWMDAKDNDSFAILVVGILVLSMFLTMSV